MDFEEAFETLVRQVETILSPLLETNGGTQKDVVMGSKNRGQPETPWTKVIFDDLDLVDTTIGSTGHRESWTMTMRIGVTEKELDDPILGQIRAAAYVSQAKKLILANRQLGIPQLVRRVDSQKIQIVPFPFGQKKTLYGAAVTFKLLMILEP